MIHRPRPRPTQCKPCGCPLRLAEYGNNPAKALAAHLKDNAACCHDYLDLRGEVFSLDRANGSGPIPVILDSMHAIRRPRFRRALLTFAVTAVSIIGELEELAYTASLDEAEAARRQLLDTIRRYRREGVPAL
jgi:hypothetical protein